MAVATRGDLLRKLAQGDGWHGVFDALGQSTGSTTAAAAGSGHFTVQYILNRLGTTYPGTLVGLQRPPSPPNELLSTAHVCVLGANVGLLLAWFYKLGTLNLALTGDQFTHNSATFPVTRTQFGASAQPVTLLPSLFVTTATTSTAAVFQLKTDAGGAGYVDQDGNNVVGTKSFTMPSSATAVNSAFFLLLENGDTGVRDITQIDVGTAAMAGAADIWGIEPLACFSGMEGRVAVPEDAVFSGMNMVNLNPAEPTSGSLTSFLAFLMIGTTGTNQVVHGSLAGVLNS